MQSHCCGYRLMQNTAGQRDEVFQVSQEFIRTEFSWPFQLGQDKHSPGMMNYKEDSGSR